MRTRLLRDGLAAPRRPLAETSPVPAAPPPSLERIAATAAARAARSASGLAATAEAVCWRGASLAELPELMAERSLIAVIEAGGDRLGIAALCPSLLGSLIEMQAMGRVTARPFATRRPTRADATLAADFINHLLGEVGQATQALPGQSALIGYRYASYLDDPRPLALMLEDCGFRTVRIELRLGAGGERRGVLFLALPSTTGDAAPGVPATAPAPGRALANAATAPAPLVAPAAPQLAAAVRSAPVPLAAVLCRRQISLRELRALTPGATLALPRATLDDASLETLRGQKLASAKLGEAKGFYALRLRGPKSRDALPGGGEAVPMRGTARDIPQSAAGDEAPPRPDFPPSAQAAPDSGGYGNAAGLEPPIADLGGPDAFRALGEGPAAAVLPLQRATS